MKKYGVLIGCHHHFVVEIPRGVTVNKRQFNPTSFRGSAGFPE
ncbi:MAG: hypothetical protein BWY97_00047 [Tenericutes bacterium ADurb.BinA124]|nr:MAG: hypothetical protein BWY97_00047 [Tenericutes bacterium ADurb.BinA124]